MTPALDNLLVFSFTLADNGLEFLHVLGPVHLLVVALHFFTKSVAAYLSERIDEVGVTFKTGRGSEAQT